MHPDFQPSSVAPLNVRVIARTSGRAVGLRRRVRLPGYGRRVTSNLEVVKAWVNACNHSDVDGALALCDSSIELVEAKTLPGAVTASGAEAVRRYLERFTAHWSEFEWLPEEFWESEDKVVMSARLRLRGRRSGIEVERAWVYVFTVTSGKLFSQQGFDKRAEGLRAAGIDVSEGT
jgi:ketosteroid isomerase-like protein